MSPLDEMCLRSQPWFTLNYYSHIFHFPSLWTPLSQPQNIPANNSSLHLSETLCVCEHAEQWWSDMFGFTPVCLLLPSHPHSHMCLITCNHLLYCSSLLYGFKLNRAVKTGVKSAYGLLVHIIHFFIIIIKILGYLMWMYMVKCICWVLKQW